MKAPDEYRFGMDLDKYQFGMDTDTQLFVGDAKELERLKDEHSRLKTKFIF